MADRRSRTAVVLVRNSVTHDSRVLREAQTLRGLGFEVLIVGLARDGERQAEFTLDGVQVVLLSREQPLRRLFRSGWEATRAAPSSEPVLESAALGGTAGSEARAPASRKVRLRRLRRMLGRIAYSLHGITLVWQVAPVLVHANDYNTMWIGIAAKLGRRSRLVYDAHELWPDQGLPEWRPRMVACEWLFVRVADATVAANPGIAETMAQRYRVAPPTVVRNVAERVVQQPGRAEGLRGGAPPLAVHVGGVVPERGIEQMIGALALVPELRLRFVGYGSDEYIAELRECAAAAGVADRIEFRPAVDPAAVAETIAGADFGVVLTQPTCLNNVRSLPNKLFEYAAADLPIVASDLPVIAALIEGEEIGEVVPPSDVEAIAAAMRRLADPARNTELRDHLRDFAQRVNWPTERQLLEGVYTGLSRDWD